MRYVLDMAEIPTFQRRQIVDANGDGRISRAEAARESSRLVAIVAPHLHLVADGRPVRLAMRGGARRASRAGRAVSRRRGSTRASAPWV